MIKEENMYNKTGMEHTQLFSEIRWIIRLLQKGYAAEEIAGLSEFFTEEEIKILKEDLTSASTATGDNISFEEQSEKKESKIEDSKKEESGKEESGKEEFRKRESEK